MHMPTEPQDCRQAPSVTLLDHHLESARPLHDTQRAITRNELP